MTFGSILYRIGGEQSWKCKISCYRKDRKFHFSPCFKNRIIDNTGACIILASISTESTDLPRVQSACEKTSGL